MAKSTFHWGSFLGGEYGKRAQGNLLDPRYSTAMNLCLNNIPLEQGACTRRPATWFLGASHKGWPGKVRSFKLKDNSRAVMEFTADPAEGSGFLRLWCRPYNGSLGDSPLTLYCDQFDTGNCTVSTANPAVLTTASAQTWSTGDYVVLFRSTGETVACRQFYIVKLTTTTFALYDSVTGIGVNGSVTVTPELVSATGFYKAGRVKVWSTLYTKISQVKPLRFVAADKMVFVLDGSKVATPYVITITYNSAAPDFTFAFADAKFAPVDGPFLDPLTGASQTNNSLGTVVLDVDTVTWDFAVTDSAYTFSSVDLGRGIRLWNQPPAWASGTSYSIGAQVTYNNTYWKLAKSSVPAGTAPGQNYVTGGVSYAPWELMPDAGRWTFGTIAEIKSGTTVRCGMNAVPNPNGTVVDTWQLGVYITGQYPTCGTWHEGRLWLGGAIPNRFDSTISNITADNFPFGQALPSKPAFSPTDQYGNVLDSSGISYTLNADEINDIIWMAPDHQGIVCGTPSNEFLISASQNNDPLTPTSIQAHKVSKYGSVIDFFEPPFVGPAILFLQTDGKTVYEYLADAFTQRYVGRPLNTKARHLASELLTDLCWQAFPTPILWTLNKGDGTLVGCTYRRFSRFATEEPTVYGWHQHTLGSIKKFDSITIAAQPDGNDEGVVGLASTSLTDYAQPRYLEFMTPIMEEGDGIQASMFCDEAQRVGFASDAITGGGGGGTTGVHGKYYFEVKLENTAASSHGSLVIGVASRALMNNGYGLLQTDPNVAVFTAHNGQAVISGAGYGAGEWAGYTDGDWVGIAVDTTNRLIWIRNVTTNSIWAPGSPSTPSGGLSTSGIDTSLGLYIFFGGNGFAGTDKVTLNTIGSFLGTLPTGYSAWGAVAWGGSPYLLHTDSSEDMTLSNAGLTAAITQVVGTADTTNGTVALYTLIWEAGRVWNSGSSTDSSDPDLNAGWANALIGVLATGGKASP